MPTTVRRAKKKRASVSRFHVDHNYALVYPRGFLSTLGLGKSNLAVSVVNLTRDGAMTFLNRRLSNGTPVHLRITTSKSAEIFDVDGEVSWSFRSSATQRLFRTEIRFTHLPPGEVWKIDLLLHCFTQKLAPSPETKFRLLP